MAVVVERTSDLLVAVPVPVLDLVLVEDALDGDHLGTRPSHSSSVVVT